MTTEPRPRRSGRRSTAVLLSIALTGLGVAASPLVAGTAHADGPQCDQTSVLACLDLATTLTTGQVLHLGLKNEGSSDNGNEVYARPGDAAGKWSFRVNDTDGSFQIVNNGTGKCVESKADESLFFPQLWDCSGTDAQKFYVHKDDDQGNYRIRNVSNDRCLDAQRMGDHPNESVRGLVEIYGCHNAGSGQAWHPAAMNPAPELSSELDRLATLHALKQFDAGSSVIKEAKYSITDSTQKATQGAFQVVSVSSDQGGSSPYCVNHSGPSGGDMTCGFSWQQSVADTISSSHTVGISATVGTNSKSPVAASITASYQHTWGTSQTTTATSGSSVSITVPPGQTAWVARALAYKTVTGTWTITNDLGRTWTGQGTSSKPVEGIDGVHSILAKCTTDSTEPGCKATALPGTASK
ncbi:RICIN domain-containing protein [Streptomyces inhibens]|uniref:RICIN domain-containing protein n=1 Tax=Streptomyces inhibens TaxID=2293571 RepID=UPI00402AC792